MSLSTKDIHQARQWLSEYAREAAAEVPLKLHTREAGGLGAAPPFTDAFNAYIGHLTCGVPGCTECSYRPSEIIESDEYREKKRGNRSNRTTKALRRLRRIAPLEFDVLYMVLLQRLSLSQVVARLNERAARKGNTDEKYDLAAVTILAVTGAEKLRLYF